MTKRRADKFPASAPVDLDASLDKLGETLSDRLRERSELLASLKTLFRYIEDGTLVRDISKDANSDWGTRMMEFVVALSKAKTAIDRAEGK